MRRSNHPKSQGKLFRNQHKKSENFDWAGSGNLAKGRADSTHEKISEGG